jgi:hypothetical protein
VTLSLFASSPIGMRPSSVSSRMISLSNASRTGLSKKIPPPKIFKLKNIFHIVIKKINCQENIYTIRKNMSVNFLDLRMASETMAWILGVRINVVTYQNDAPEHG